ncbi:hypothetical protein ROZALSC1DRAFT_26063, partial [Rozella allomycis CSF55]
TLIFFRQGLERDDYRGCACGKLWLCLRAWKNGPRLFSFIMKFLAILFLLACSAIATKVSPPAPEEINLFDIHRRINDFLDVKSSERFRLTKKSLYHNVALNADIVFHWFSKCGPYFNGIGCGQDLDDIQ